MFHISVLIEEHSRDECATQPLVLCHAPLNSGGLAILMDLVAEKTPEKLLCCRNGLLGISRLSS